MKRLWIVSVFLFLGALMIPICVPSPPLVMAQDGGFSETFDETNLEGWEHTPEVIINDGVLRLYGGNFVFRMGGWGDQETTILLRFESTEGEFFIHYLATDQGSYNLIFRVGTILLEKSTGPASSLILAELAKQVPMDTWIELTIRVDGEQHTITLDGEIILTAVDPDPIRSGTIGFIYHGPDFVEIDSIRLSPLGGMDVPPPEVREEEEIIRPTAAARQDENTSLTEILQGILQPQPSQIDLVTYTVNMLLSAILAFILGRVYIYWGGSLSNRRKFATNFMLITVTTTFIILVVRSSVALSLGLVGALSIVRFRTAVKEPEELAYLFFAIAIGIGLGDNQRVVTILAFAATILIVGLLRLFRQTESDVNLHLTVTSHNPEKISLDELMSALKPHTTKLKLLRMDDSQQALELAFLVEFKHIDQLGQAKNAIQTLAPDVSITFLDNKGIW